MIFGTRGLLCLVGVLITSCTSQRRLPAPLPDGPNEQHAVAPEASPPAEPESAAEIAPQPDRKPKTTPTQPAHGHAHEHADAHRHGSGYQMDFSEVERFAKHFDDPKRDAWQKPEQLIRLMGALPGQHVADLGAGTGYFVPHLSRAVGPSGKVLALDVEPKMVQYLERRVLEHSLGNVEARHIPADDPGLAPGSVDRIVTINTWHHIAERPTYAGKLARALKPGGSLWVVDFTLDSDIGPPPDHRLSPARVVTELESGGLHAEVVTDESLPKQYIVKGW